MGLPSSVPLRSLCVADLTINEGQLFTCRCQISDHLFPISFRNPGAPPAMNTLPSRLPPAKPKGIEVKLE